MDLKSIIFYALSNGMKGDIYFLKQFQLNLSRTVTCQKETCSIATGDDYTDKGYFTDK